MVCGNESDLRTAFHRLFIPEPVRDHISGNYSGASYVFCSLSEEWFMPLDDCVEIACNTVSIIEISPV